MPKAKRTLRLALEIEIESQTYTRPLRRQLALIDQAVSTGDPNAFAARRDDVLAAIEDSRRLIREDFTDKALPDGFIDVIRDHALAGRQVEVRFSYEVLARTLHSSIDNHRRRPKSRGRPPTDASELDRRVSNFAKLIHAEPELVAAETLNDAEKRHVGALACTAWEKSAVAVNAVRYLRDHLRAKSKTSMTPNDCVALRMLEAYEASER